MFGMNPREMKRLLKRMGIKADMEEMKAVRVIVEHPDGSRSIVEEPVVSVIRFKGTPQVTLSVMGVLRYEEAVEAGEEASAGEEAYEPSEEDVKLVVEQTGASPEEARRALIETRGDIAEAIMKLLGG